MFYLTSDELNTKKSQAFLFEMPFPEQGKDHNTSVSK